MSQPPGILSLGSSKTVAKRRLTAFSSILLILLWYVPQYEREVENTILVFPQNARKGGSKPKLLSRPFLRTTSVYLLVMYLNAIEAMSSRAEPSRSLSSMFEAIWIIALPDDCGAAACA